MIYMMAAEEFGLCKIGFTKDLNKRLKSVQQGVPFALEVVAERDGTIALEKSIHRACRENKTRGEWFRYDDSVVELFHSTELGYEIPKIKYARDGASCASPIPDLVRKAIRNGETAASLAKRAGLHRNSLYGCDKDGWNPTLSTLDALAAILPEQTA